MQAQQIVSCDLLISGSDATKLRGKELVTPIVLLIYKRDLQFLVKSIRDWIRALPTCALAMAVEEAGM